MSTKIRLEGGPYAGQTIAVPQQMEQIGLGVNEAGEPDQGDSPIAVVVYRKVSVSEGVDLFKLLGFRRQDGGKFSIEFADGPAKGFNPAPQPAQFLEPTQRMPVKADETAFRGDGEIAGEAVYERRKTDGKWKYHFVAIERDAERIKALNDEAKERRLDEALSRFYESPNYGIYSKPPTDDHPQVLVELRKRRAHVDEKIAPVILLAWKLGMDTLGSCQQILSDKKSEKAYVAFPKQADARRFEKVLAEAGIDAAFEPKSLTVARKSDTGEIGEKFSYETANITFASADIGRVADALSKALNP